MTKKEKIIEKYKKYIMPTYIHTDVVFVRGKGAAIWDTEGNEYLDFFPGWAVTVCGNRIANTKPVKYRTAII